MHLYNRSCGHRQLKSLVREVAHLIRYRPLPGLFGCFIHTDSQHTMLTDLNRCVGLCCRGAAWWGGSFGWAIDSLQVRHTRRHFPGGRYHLGASRCSWYCPAAGMWICWSCPGRFQIVWTDGGAPDMLGGSSKRNQRSGRVDSTVPPGGFQPLNEANLSNV